MPVTKTGISTSQIGEFANIEAIRVGTEAGSLGELAGDPVT